MSQPSEPRGVAMPKTIDFILTNRIPCSLTVVVMLTAVYWTGVLFGNLPIFGAVTMVAGMLLHLSVPIVFALTLFGGGMGYSLQVGLIAAGLILLLSAGDVNIALLFLAVFVWAPVSAAEQLRRFGVSRAAWVLAGTLFAIVMLAFAVSMDEGGLKDFVAQIFAPMFDDVIKGVPEGDAKTVSQIRTVQTWVVSVFPALLVFSLWLVWWSSVLYARSFAKRYDFYTGALDDVQDLRLPLSTVPLLLVLGVISMLAAGDMQYVASNALLLTLGLIAVQGVAVVHTLLQRREMMNIIIIMYVMIFFWSGILVIFMLIGLLDFWFNFRRNEVSTTGEK